MNLTLHLSLETATNLNDFAAKTLGFGLDPVALLA